MYPFIYVKDDVDTHYMPNIRRQRVNIRTPLYFDTGCNQFEIVENQKSTRVNMCFRRKA